VSGDLHSPTTAAPEPALSMDAIAAQPPRAESHADGGLASSLPIDPAERPEVLVGAAFAGGLLAAMILKRLGR
jgi:hypothetical protein